jgi:hypothetical protein
MQEKIAAFVQFPNPRNAFITVVQREENIFLRISHEKLNAALYPYISIALCEDYIYVNLLTPEEISEQQIKEYYDAVNADGEDLFDFVYANFDESSADTSSSNFLLSPIRGLMSVMVVIGGFAVAMFYMQDEARGTFDRLPNGRRFAFSIEYHAVAVFDIAIAVLAALLLTGLSVGFWRELAALLMYIVITVGFCIGLRLLCKDIRLLGALAPVLAVIMVVLCPVFFNVSALPAIQYLLPPYYYLNAIYDPEFFGYMAIYAIAVYGADHLLYRLQTR